MMSVSRLLIADITIAERKPAEFTVMNFSEELSKLKAGSKEYIFFEKVLSKLGPNFIRKSVADRLRETHNNLNAAKQKYFEWYIIANTVIKSAEQSEREDTISTNSCIPSSKDIHPLYLNIVQKYLPPKDSSGVVASDFGLFGLCQENTSKAVENTKSEVKTLAFKKLVEENVRDFCVKITECIGDNSFPNGEWEEEFDKAMKRLESKVVLLTSEESKGQSKKQLIEMIKIYNKELSEGVSLLSKLLTLHEKNLEFESDLAEFYRHRCQAISLKIKLFELKILEATYNQETLPALKKIGAQLDQSELKMKEEENEKAVALEQYLKLGKEYERFVDEYANLIKNIKEQQWAIDELKSKKSQYEACS